MRLFELTTKDNSNFCWICDTSLSHDGSFLLNIHLQILSLYCRCLLWRATFDGDATASDEGFKFFGNYKTILTIVNHYDSISLARTAAVCTLVSRASKVPEQFDNPAKFV